MANSKKRKFVVRKISKAPIEGDLFYFDQGAWDEIMAAAIEHCWPGRAPRSQVLKGLETKRRRKLEKQRAIVAARSAEKTRRFYDRRRGPAMRDKIITAMVPGQWHGAIDIAGASGIDRRHVRQVLALALLPGSLVTSAINPDWRGNTRNVEPEKLWRLTPAGEIERAAVAPSVMAGKRYEKRAAGFPAAKLSHATERD